MTHSYEDFSTIPDDAWTLIEQDETQRRYACRIDDKRIAIKTEFLGNDDLIVQNQRDHHESFGKRFGDFARVSSIPMNVLYDPKTQLMEKLREGDKDHLKWFLNSEQARPWRTFRGKI